MKKIVVSGGWSYGNIGDEVIAKVTIEILKKYFPLSKIIYTSYDPDDFYYQHGINAIESVHAVIESNPKIRLNNIAEVLLNTEKYGLQNFVECIDKETLFIMSGGGYFDGSWESQFLARVIEIEAAINAGAKVAILGQSIGPVYSSEQEEHLARVLDKCEFINVRDDASLQLIKQLLPKKKVSCSCDIALLVSDFYPIESKKSNRVNVIVQNYAKYVKNGKKRSHIPLYNKIMNRVLGEKYKYDYMYLKLLKKLLKDGKQVQIVMNVCSTKKRTNNHFLKYAKRIQSKLPKIAINENKCVNNMIFELATAECIISCKMHPLIVSASYGVETFAIAQHYKIDAFMKWIGRENFCYRNSSFFCKKIYENILTSENYSSYDFKDYVLKNKKEIFNVLDQLKNTFYKE